ncbi:MAG: LytTR family DNA-binding domain-containing protein [Coriobacteriales bacterium]|jgi:DNA-binding LytR/AlgR family response regulator|nr:LytTR family DNA-binding domain-containing protein [Coriobacteriales bacterium]
MEASTDMTVLRIAICEDTPSDAERLTSFISLSTMSSEVAQYVAGEKLLEVFERGMYDLIFLDVYMGALTGVQTAQRIRELDSQVVIVFTTTSDDFTREGYRLNAYKYLLKPLEADDVSDALELATLKRDKAQGAAINIVSEGKPVAVPMGDIIYVESRNRKSLVVTAAATFSTATSIDALEKMLPAPRFLRSHRSFIVNLDHVEDIDEDFAMDNGGRAYIRVKDFRAVKRAYDSYLFNTVRSSG